MSHVQIIPGKFTITDPDWPRIHLWRPGFIFTSDDFSADGDPVGRMTSAALGGQPTRWEGNAGAWSAEGGVLKSPAGTGSIFLDLPGADFAVESMLHQLPTTSQVLLIGRRSAIAYNPTISQVRVQIYNDGLLQLQEQVSGTLRNLGESGVKVVAGDSVGLRLRGRSVSLLVNGQTALAAETDVSGAGFCGLSVTNSGTAASIDDLVITAL